jgi:hypothetical protein
LDRELINPHSINHHIKKCRSSPDVIRKIKIRIMRQMRNAYKISVRASEGKRPLGRPGRRWEDNIKINFRETGFGTVD